MTLMDRQDNLYFRAIHQRIAQRTQSRTVGQKDVFESRSFDLLSQKLSPPFPETE